MTQGIFPFPQGQQRFDTVDDRLPPCNIEAEEAVLGGILFDPNAIYRIKDRLKPEHFYISAHKDIYQACVRLCRQDESTDLLNLTSWLTDHDILARIGGRNKLAALASNTVSAVNIDELATLIIKKAVRRELIATCNEIRKLAYQTELEEQDIFSISTEKFKAVVEAPLVPTKDDYQRWKHDRLLQELTTIYTMCVEPSFRFLKLKDLADEHHVSPRFLELFYLKSLTAQCTKLLTYEELKDLAGSTIREWLLNGLVPKNTTILLAADGGIGKTKFAYSIAKLLIQGGNFGVFQTTGHKRRILYYQGDESPDDMLQALESMGYSERDIGKYVRVRFGWSAENMPALIQDLKEFQPDFVVIDSLSTANKYSVYQESQMEYARPILEMTGLALQYKVTFLIIHHTNREGGVRGTTAIRNAVSEVWTLTQDKTQQGTPNDRILEINKSRSRSSGKKYRMIFSPDDLSFTFLGEEYEQGYDPSEKSAREQALEFFSANRNIKFTAQEVAHRTGISSGYTRVCLSGLAADGLISVDRQPGRANLYFLAMEEVIGGQTPDHPTITPNSLSNVTETTTVNESQPLAEESINNSTITHDHPTITPTITPHDHPINVEQESDTAEGDRYPYTFNLEKDSESSEKKSDFGRSPDHLRLNALPDIQSGGDRAGDREVIVAQDDHLPSATELPLLPLIQEKGVYFSLSCKREVTVFQIFDNLSEVSCQVPGRGRIGLPFTDLRCCDKSPRHNLSVGDKVVIIEGKHKDTFATVTTIRADGIWLKSEQGKSLRPAFFPHQVVKG